MKVTWIDKNCPFYSYEQDADEFFKEMAEPCIPIMPFRLDSQDRVEELLKTWIENGWLTETAAKQIRKEWEDKPFPIDGPLPIPSGHTKGYMMLKNGTLKVEDVDVSRFKARPRPTELFVKETEATK